MAKKLPPKPTPDATAPIPSKVARGGQHSRRSILKLSALGVGAATVGAATFGCLPAALPAIELPFEPGSAPVDAAEAVGIDVIAPAEDPGIFGYGVQAGDAKPTSALLWTITAAPVVTLRVWREGERDDEVLMLVEREETPDETGLIRTVVEGLSPGTRYHYAFFDDVGADAGGGRSAVGTVRAAYEDGEVWPVIVGAGTCTSFAQMPYDALSVLAKQDLDVFVHVGDMSYNDGSVTLEDFREKWRRTLADPGYRAVLPKASMLMSWDDHEFTNNLNPETEDSALIINAKTSFFDHIPVTPGPDFRLWQSHQWGDSVEFITLDSRSERVPSTRNTDETVYIGAEQMAFFKERLKNSTARFKVVLNSVPITQMTELWASAGDRWQGYSSQREEILDFLVDEDIHDVYFLSGDFHVGFVARVEATGPRSRFWEIAVGPSGNLGNPLAGLIEIDPFEYGPLIFPEEQFLYGKGRLAATTLLFNPFSGGVRVKFIDAADESILFDDTIFGTEA